MTSKTVSAGNNQPVVNVPGDSKSFTKTMLEMGASAMQNFDPVKQLRTHLCGFAFYKDEPQRQVELHHFCHVLNEDFIQCIVYDGWCRFDILKLC